MRITANFKDLKISNFLVFWGFQSPIKKKKKTFVKDRTKYINTKFVVKWFIYSDKNNLNICIPQLSPMLICPEVADILYFSSTQKSQNFVMEYPQRFTGSINFYFLRFLKIYKCSVPLQSHAFSYKL